MRILGFFFILGLLFFALTLLFGFSFLRMIFGTKPKPRNTTSSQQKSKQPPKQTNTPSIKKIITREEGEYVDFEEIKDS